MNSEKLNIKDIITVVLLSLINILIYMSASLLYASPVTILLMPIIFSLLEGIVFFTIGVKIRKKGTLFLYCAVRGILGGYLPYIICYLLAGLIAELIQMKSGYGRKGGLTICYMIIQLLASAGGTFYPYVLAYNSFFGDKEEFVKANNGENVLAAADMLHSWVGIALIIGILVASFIGALIGRNIIKKHLISDAVGETCEK